MMRLLSLFIILFFSLSLHAENTQGDSLLALSEKAKSDTARIRLMNAAIKELRTAGNNKKALEVADRLYELGVRSNDHLVQATALNYSGQSLFALSKYDTSLVVFERALALKEKFRDPKLESQISLGIGMVYYQRGVTEKASHWFRTGLDIASKAGDSETVALAYNHIGNLHVQKGEYAQGLPLLKKSLDIRLKLNDKRAIASSHHNIANTYYGLADYPRAMEHYLQSLRIKRELNDKPGIGSTLNNIGAISRIEKDYKNAIAYYTESMKIREETGNKQGYAITVNNLGNIYEDMGQYDKALEYFKKSLEIRNEINDKKGKAIVLSNIGSVYGSKKDHAQALHYYEQALVVQQEINDRVNQAVTFHNIGETHLEKGNMKKAIEFGLKSLELTEGTGAIVEQRLAADLLYNAYKNDNNAAAALKYHEKLLTLTDSIYNTEKSTKVNMLKTQFALDQQEAELKAAAKAEREKLQAVSLAERKRQRTVLYSVIGGLAMLLVFSGFLFNRFQVIKKQNLIIENQKALVEEKNRDITDSINYAKRIQTSILAPAEEIAAGLKDVFILYMPKDIVSGDFYYLAQMHDENIIAVADCTGHGVPGAFMSLIGNNLLDQIIKEKNITEPARVLDLLNDGVRKVLHQEHIMSESRDGMDIALCSINKVTRQLRFSGAMRNLYVLRKNGTLEEVKADKLSIGGSGINSGKFSSSSLYLDEGDSFYLLSDGYADQFGGEGGKKFMTKRLKDLLISFKGLSMTEQRKKLESVFLEWKGSLEQIDDVCVIGVTV